MTDKRAASDRLNAKLAAMPDAMLKQVARDLNPKAGTDNYEAETLVLVRVRTELNRRTRRRLEPLTDDELIVEVEQMMTDPSGGASLDSRGSIAADVLMNRHTEAADAASHHLDTVDIDDPDLDPWGDLRVAISAIQAKKNHHK